MNPYEDILTLPHHRSATRRQMPRLDRAAQFAPFAALNGYGEAIDETARLTEDISVLCINALPSLIPLKNRLYFPP